MTTSSRNSNSTCDCHDFIANSHACTLGHTHRLTHRMREIEIERDAYINTHLGTTRVHSYECECALVNAFYKLFYASHKYALYTLRISLSSPPPTTITPSLYSPQLSNAAARCNSSCAHNTNNYP